MKLLKIEEEDDDDGVDKERASCFLPYDDLIHAIKLIIIVSGLILSAKLY